MSTPEVLAVMIIVAVVLVWWITWLATRVNRATVRAEHTWSVLDAAAAALEPELRHGERERAESDLSHVLDMVDPMLRTNPSELDSEQIRASMYRRLHNDAVATALSLRRRHTVRILRLAGRTVEPRPFEMADGAINRHNARGRELGWPRAR